MRNSPTKKHLNFPVIAGVVCAAIALILSILLVCKHSGVCTSAMGCKIDGVDGCSELGGSIYSRFNIPFTNIGISIAWFGLFYYALVFFLFLRLLFTLKDKSKNQALALLAGIALSGFCVDIFLAYRNFFTLVIPCLLCAYTYICQVAILIAAMYLYFSPESEKKTGSSLAILWQETKAVRLPIGGAVLVSLLFMLIFLLSDGSKVEKKVGADSDLLPMSQVASTLRELHSLKAVDIPTTGLNAYEGEEGAYIIVHEWIDFRCPHCYQAVKAMQAAKKRWPGRVKVYYRNFPLDATCNPHMNRRQPDAASCKAAQAALCAARKDYFPQFFHGLFAFQASRTHISHSSLAELTQSIGGNWSQIQNCMRSSSTQAALAVDLRASQLVKISATPTIALAGHLLPSGIPTQSWFFRVLDALVLQKEGEDAIEDYENRKFINSQ